MRRIAVAVVGVLCGGLVAVLGYAYRSKPAAEPIVLAPKAEPAAQKQLAKLSADKPMMLKKIVGPVHLGDEGMMGKKGVASALLGAGGVGEARGIGGLGLRGVGSGGGGAVSGSAGIGSIGTTGQGSGGAYRSAGLLKVIAGTGSAGLQGYASSREGGSGYDSAGTESYGQLGPNPFVSTAEDHLSTFGVDVDTASYTVARRKLLEGSLPPPESVRVEEFLNYFRYQYPQPEKGALAVFLDAAPSPFTKGRHVLRVGVQGKRLSIGERKPAHLTFLVDVSGSMASPDKLPLAKRALRTLVDNLRDGDTVALVTYASGSRVVLPATGLEHKAQLHAAIEDLTAGGSTAMSGGITLAYQEAMKTVDGRSVSRVIICSDGDANVGATTHEAMFRQIQGYVKEGVTVSTVGFGMGNYKDDLMEQFADKGNGNHAYVDSALEARRIFQEQLGGTLEVIAKDVKLQVDFDPQQVAAYRLVGYENRAIADEDFRNDKVDAGEIGAGHTVTALYELELRPGAGAGLATVRVRAKSPTGNTAQEGTFPFPARALASSFGEASRDLRFATAVMGAAEIFRRSPHAQSWSYDQVVRTAREATPEGNAEREEFIALLEQARAIVTRVAVR
jgi:Ca-activated chloride channel family protein